MPRITISYRRDDSGVITGRIFDRLAAHYGRESVFRDIDNIPPGVDFRKHINEMLDASDIVLAIVGPKWVGPRTNQSRLANAADPVRVEIETALRKNKPLIPVLVLRANMPRLEHLPDSIADFAFRHALAVDAGQDFDVHIDRVIRSMNRVLDANTERAARDGVEQFAELVEAAPEIESPEETEPKTPLEEPPSDPSAELLSDIEALKETNRALQSKIAKLTTAHEHDAEAATRLRDEMQENLLQREQEASRLVRQLSEVQQNAAARTDEHERALRRANEEILKRAAVIEELNQAGRAQRRWRPAIVIPVTLALVVSAVLITTGSVKGTYESALAGAHRELDSRSNLADQLAAEQRANNTARAQVDQLTTSITALRDQLARVAAALDASEAKVKEREGQILELGRRLNGLQRANVIKMAADYGYPEATAALALLSGKKACGG